ncbi:MAG: AAA family ATPase [Candidatus Hodarchaeota archaeon]
MVSWTLKYTPKRRSEIVGNKETVDSIIGYLNRFRNPKLRENLSKRALLLHGPPGVGKTSSVFAIANALNFDVVAVNASDKRNKESLRSVRNAALFSSLKIEFDSKIIGQILLIDEVDGLSGNADRGGIKEIIDIIKMTRVPLILTANDVSPQKFKALRNYCELREFEHPTSEDIMIILKRIIKAESILVSNQVLLNLIELSQNDIRGSINSLQTLASGKKEILESDLNVLTYRDTSVEIREFLRTLLVEVDGNKAYRQTRVLSDVDYGKILLLLRDICISVIPSHDYGKISQVYNLLARADLALCRAQRKRIWSQLGYFYNIITKELATIISPVDDLPPIPDWRLQVPSYWIMLSRQKKGKNIARKVGKACMVSEKDATNYYLPYLHFIFDNDPEMAANLAITFQLFDIEPGKRKTRIIWNGEIDFFSKKKDINREIKKRVRELYPQIARIVSQVVDKETLKTLKEQQKIQFSKPDKQKKPVIRTRRRKKDNSELEMVGTRIKRKPDKKSSNKMSPKKTLSDFF